MKKCVIFDIDSTIADDSHRVHYLQKQPKEWDNYFAGMADDLPIKGVIDTLVMYMRAGLHVVYITGRPNAHKRKTVSWLIEHVLGCEKEYITEIAWDIIADKLFMRADNDYRPAPEMKEEILLKLISKGYTPVAAFDDDIRCVKMYQSHGITGYHVPSQIGWV